MTIRRGATGGDRFAQILNGALQDRRLSFRARGILACIVSRPLDWAGSAEALTEGSPSEGRDAIRTALRELEAHGYMRRVRTQGERGRWATHWEVSDDPALLAPQTVIPLDLASSQVGPMTDSQSSVDQPSVGRPSVGQASKDKHDLQTRSVPNGTGRSASRSTASPESLVAKSVYDHAEGMVEFMAIQQIAKRALRTVGATVESVSAAMTALYDDGRPITLQTVGQRLAGKAPQSRLEAPSTTDQRVMDWQALKDQGDGPAAIGGGS